MGPRLGVRRQRLSDAEVAELVFNAGKSLQERVSPVVHRAAGVSWSISYGADEIGAMIEARRYGLLVTSLLAPVFVAVAVIGFALALLVGQPLYLLLGLARRAPGLRHRAGDHHLRRRCARAARVRPRGQTPHSDLL